MTDTEPRGGVEGIDEIDQGLADLSSQCTFDAGTGVMALVLEAGDIAWLSVGTGGKLEVNNIACGSATVPSTKRIEVTEASAGVQTVIVDARTGALGLGRSTGPGLTLALGADSDELKLIGTISGDRVILGAAGISFGADTYLDYTLASVENVTINGDAGGDTISGAGDAVTGAAFMAALDLYGGEGNDTLRGGAASDRIWGGDGDDTFVGGAVADGADTWTGGAGRDTADYTARAADLALSLDGAANDGAAGEGDTLAADIEVVRGGTGNDTITGGANADTLYGGPGDDTLRGGAGADVLYGDAGNDTFDDGASANGADTFVGGTGTDTIQYTRSGGATIALDGSATSGAAGEGDKIETTVENALGGPDADTLRGNTGANVLDGAGGNDTIYGGAGNDTLLGGTGANTLHGEAGDDRFDQGASALGSDTLAGGAGTDIVDYAARSNDVTVVCDGQPTSGEAGENDRVATDVEVVIGGAGNDTLTGHAGDNQLEGRGGNDALFGLGGDDVLDGEGGNDALDCGAGDADIALDLTTSSRVGCEL